MKKTIALFALVVLACACPAVMTGCHSDPHDTHITTGVSAPR